MKKTSYVPNPGKKKTATRAFIVRSSNARTPMLSCSHSHVWLSKPPAKPAFRRVSGENATRFNRKESSSRDHAEDPVSVTDYSTHPLDERSGHFRSGQ